MVEEGNDKEVRYIYRGRILLIHCHNTMVLRYILKGFLVELISLFCFIYNLEKLDHTIQSPWIQLDHVFFLRIYSTG